MSTLEQEIADLKNRVTRLETLLLAATAKDPHPV